jgi:hypothetical protein
MKPGIVLKMLFVVLVTAAVCACEEGVREQITRTKTVDLGEAESVDVELNMGAGELNLEGGASALLESTFVSRYERRIPEVTYSVFGKKGKLSIRERRRSGIHFGGGKNRWDIRLDNRVPMDMKIDLGAGETDLDLRGFQIQRLDIDMGVGAMTLDLSGERGRDLDVKVDGGIGHATIFLPDTIGVRAEIDGGIGSVSARHFNKSGHVYTNQAHGKAGVTIDLRVEAGIGSIDLKLR